MYQTRLIDMIPPDILLRFLNFFKPQQPTAQDYEMLSSHAREFISTTPAGCPPSDTDWGLFMEGVIGTIEGGEDNEPN